MTKTEYRKCFRFFVTLPQSGEYEPEDIFKLWRDSDYHFKELAWVVEKHEDGGNHIHWSFELKHSLTRNQVLMKFASIYPDASARIDVKSGKKTVSWMYEHYCAKEGIPYYKNYKAVKSLWTAAEQAEWSRIKLEIENDNLRAKAIEAEKQAEEICFDDWLQNEEQWERARKEWRALGVI